MIGGIQWVFRDYRLVDGVILPTSLLEYRDYDPLEELSLPVVFSELRDANGALEFVRRYGLLGWQPGVPEEGRESLIVSDTEYGYERQFIDLDERDASLVTVEELPLPAPGSLPYARSMVAQAERAVWLLAWARCINGILESLRETEKGNDEDRAQAALSLAQRVNIGLRHCTRRLYFQDGRWFDLVSDQLLGSIFWLLANQVSNREIRFCAAIDCGKPFLATDKRQRFCPPPSESAAGTISRCQNRDKVRRYRARKVASDS